MVFWLCGERRYESGASGARASEMKQAGFHFRSPGKSKAKMMGILSVKERKTKKGSRGSDVTRGSSCARRGMTAAPSVA